MRVRSAAFTALLALAVSLCPATTRAQEAERYEAVQWARAGDLDRAIARLRELHQTYPQDIPIVADLAVVLKWTGRDREMLEVFDTIGPAAAPDYALFEAIRAARAVGDLDRADAYARRGEERFPDESRFTALRALVAVDARRFEDARRLLMEEYGANPSDLEGLLAWAYLSAEAREIPAALRYYTEALKQAPRNREALRGRVLALEALGAPLRAKELGAEPADLLGPAERDRVSEAELAMLLRWGTLPAVDPAHRYDEIDHAIARLQQRIVELEVRPEPAGAALQHARFDLLVAYQERTRMSDAVALYERLRGEGVTVPSYARLSAASAYLYLERPEQALALYQSILDEKPRDDELRFRTRLGLFYTWVELDRYDRAYETIDALDREQPRFKRYADTGTSIENELKATTVVVAAMARSYGEQLEEAWNRLSPLAAAAPGASGLQTDLASVARGRGWRRRSLALVEPWLRVRPNDLDVSLGYASSLLDLRRYPEAGAQIEALHRVYPENKSVQSLKEDWDVHRMWEWVTEVVPSYGAEPPVAEPGFDVRTRLWSPPFADYWRVTSAYRYATEALQEGREMFQRAAVGVEYRGPDLRTFGELTYNVSTVDKLGGRAEVEWTPTDHVTLSAMGEIFSQDTPLRALKNGVTANAVQAAIGYRSHESLEMGLVWRLMDFSDDNVRHEFTATLAKRVLDRPRLKLTAAVDLYYSSNSRTDVPYFSPKWISTPTVVLTAEHVLWRRYRWSLVQVLTGTVGGTWEGGGFDAQPIGSIGYEHRWQLGPRCDVSYGVSFGSAVFDGDREQQFAGFTRVSWRF